MSRPVWTRERLAALSDAEVMAQAEEIIEALKESGGRLPSQNTFDINDAFDYALAAKTPEEKARGLEMLEKAVRKGGGG